MRQKNTPTLLLVCCVLGFLCAPGLTATAQSPSGLLIFSIYDSPPPQDNPRLNPVYTGLAISTDRGTTWKSSAWVTNRSNEVAQAPSDTSLLYIASDYGVLRSDDGGVNWKLVTPWNISFVLSICAQPSAVWIGTGHGVFVSTDKGTSWVARNNGLTTLNGRYVADLLAFDDTLLIATADGLFLSGDRALSWRRNGLQGLSIDKLHKENRTLYALSSTKGLRISRDFGTTWSEHPSTLPSVNLQSLCVDRRNPDQILVGTKDHGVLGSIDGGASWTNRSGGLTNLNITALFQDPGDPATIYLGTENGSYISRNSGQYWEPFTVHMGFISSISLFGVQP